MGLMNCDAVHRSRPLAAGALPKFDSGNATIFFIVYRRLKASFRAYTQ